MASRPVLRNNLSSAAALAQSYRLPIDKRIELKLATTTYKLLKSQQPSYIRSLIQHDAPTCIRSSAFLKLHEPFVHIAIGERAFCCAAPAIWNSIPLPIRSAPSVELFKKLINSVLHCTYFLTPPTSPTPRLPVPPFYGMARLSQNIIIIIIIIIIFVTLG